MINRRKFLKNSAVGLGAASGLASNFAAMNAFAQSGASDYKALVCVYLAGGMDGHDTLIPTDTRSSRQYERIMVQMLMVEPLVSLKSYAHCNSFLTKGICLLLVMLVL